MGGPEKDPGEGRGALRKDRHLSLKVAEVCLVTIVVMSLSTWLEHSPSSS